jgi:hypothetical protein
VEDEEINPLPDDVIGPGGGCSSARSTLKHISSWLRVLRDGVVV